MLSSGPSFGSRFGCGTIDGILSSGEEGQKGDARVLLASAPRHPTQGSVAGPMVRHPPVVPPVGFQVLGEFGGLRLRGLELRVLAFSRFRGICLGYFQVA